MKGVLDLFSLEGKAAVVTGADRGIGRAFASALAEAGADLLGSSRGPSAPETAAAVEAAGRRYAHRQADLRDRDAVSGIVSAALREYGRIDILVNNAGCVARGAALDFSESDWDEVLDVDLRAPFFLSQAAAREMVKAGRGGKIINVASMLSFQGGVRVASYTAAKSGLRGLTMILANEWAVHGIQVNAIAPGYIETDNTAPLRADGKRSAEILARIPAGRWGRPGDLAGAVVFLASSASDYMTGCTIAVDGGWLAR